jgi:tRNA threonylcarbamoyladenosine biosynthesis protein TsaB
MRILAIDTSTRTESVAVLEDGIVLAEVYTTSEQTHAKRLLSAIDATLHMAALKTEACDALAVTIGPGSFTGLRIGISTVKGLAFATGKPVAGVSSLDVLAQQFPQSRHLVCPMIDARKKQVYTALYECGNDMRLTKLADDCAIEPEKWLKQIEQPCLFVGDGIAVYGDLIKEALGERALFAPPHLNSVQASAVAAAGMKQIVEGRDADVAALEPYYIRQSDAEMNGGDRSGLLTYSSL